MCSCCSRKRCSIYDRYLAWARDLGAGGFCIEIEFERVRVSCPDCGVRREYLDWLARTMTVKDVARSERLHHSTVKDLDKLYMAEQLRRHPMPATTAIGVDENRHRQGPRLPRGGERP